MKLLKELYKIFSPSGNEKSMRRFIKRWVLSNCPGAIVYTDTAGNLYVVKGISKTYPCVVSHMDQVQHIHSKDFETIETDDIIFGYSKKNKRMEGLGADDKNGIWVCLNCLKKFDALKVVFFVGEEVGCVGSSKADMDFFNDCRFALQIDRRNGGDLITHIGAWTELCSESFLQETDFAEYGYMVNDRGAITDVGVLKDNGLKISAVNLSCGYYEPHTDHEFTVKSELTNCLSFVEHIIEKCQDVFPHEEQGFNSPYWNEYNKKSELMELDVILSDWLTYKPDLTADEAWEHYESSFGHLKKEDVIKTIEEIKKRSIG